MVTLYFDSPSIDALQVIIYCQLKVNSVVSAYAQEHDSNLTINRLLVNIGH